VVTEEHEEEDTTSIREAKAINLEHNTQYDALTNSKAAYYDTFALLVMFGTPVAD
jgi:hypothetical protein